MLENTGSEHAIEEIREKIPPDELIDDMSELFWLFGDSTRLRILYVMLSSEMCVNDISQTLGMSQSAISHQLKILRQGRLVKGCRRGKTVFYSLADGHVRTMINQAMDHVEE